MVERTEKGKAFITGASAGIGAVYAERLARRGYDLILLARDADRLQSLAANLHKSTGAEVEVVKADLSTREGREIAARKLLEDAAITLFVNNAGMAVEGTLIAADPEKLETMIELNVTAVMRLAAAAARSFTARRHGTIINIASVLALAPEILGGVYSGTKAFVLNLTQSMQVELAASGVRVQAVLPGATRTEIWDRSGGDINRLPAERLMDAEEMVDAALVGLDAGEQITIPSLPDIADFDAFTAARHALGPNLSRNHAAARYKLAESPAR
jgi:short-subunit dehydrogenase